MGRASAQCALLLQRMVRIGWDGRDDTGVLVPPGVYYARLRIDTDTEGADIDEQVLRTIAVAY